MTAMGGLQHVRRLPAGEFYGTLDRRLSFGAADVHVLGAVEDVEPHEHDAPHFVLILDGVYATSARAAEGKIGAGAAIWIPAGTHHRDAFVTQGLLVAVTPSRALLAQLGQAPRADGPCVLGARATRLVREIALEARDADATSELVVEGACLELLAGAAEAGAREPSWLALAKTRLRESCGQTCSLADLARDLGLHAVYFARAFRRHVGASPGEYQRRCRAERAAALLARTDEPLAAVALACGFSDQAAFSKSFRRVAGLTPGAFRRKWRG